MLNEKAVSTFKETPEPKNIRNDQELIKILQVLLNDSISIIKKGETQVFISTAKLSPSLIAETNYLAKQLKEGKVHLAYSSTMTGREGWLEHEAAHVVPTEHSSNNGRHFK